jgi:predicted Zn-dependent protease
VGELRIVPVNAIDSSLLARTGMCLEERFLLTASVERRVRIAQTAVNSARKQLFLNTVVAKAVAAHPVFDGYLLAITDFDLYKIAHQFIFGDASEEKRIAVVSYHRLRSDFYGDAADENLLFQRLLKECVHQLGRVMGLSRCHNVRCAMHFSTSIYDADHKSSHFCEACEKRSRASR